jgi:hypothetical protein
MRSIRWLAVVPFLALIVGPFFVNRAMRNVSQSAESFGGSLCPLLRVRTTR